MAIMRGNSLVSILLLMVSPCVPAFGGASLDFEQELTALHDAGFHVSLPPGPVPVQELRGGPGRGLSGPRASRARASKAAGEPIDLGSMFTDGVREQKDINSCHSFVTVALLEAAYFRRHGEKIRLSEADLFVQHTVLGGRVYDGFVGESATSLSESDYMELDLDFAFAHGVATAPQYEPLLEKWRRYREAEKRTLEDLLKQAKLDEQRKEELKRRFDGVAKEDAREQLSRADFELLFEEEVYDVRSHWKELQMGTLSKKTLERFLTGNSDELARQREEMRGKFKGMSRVTRTFDEGRAYDDVTDLSARECREAGSGQLAAINEELKAGRPAAVSMWDPSPANHAFLVTGTQKGKTGALMLRTRDSYYLDQPLPLAFACGIYRVTSIHEK